MKILCPLEMKSGGSVEQKKCLTFYTPGQQMEQTPAATTMSVFKVGDKVRVDLDVEILKAMQEGHGGWNPRMAEVRPYSNNLALFVNPKMRKPAYHHLKSDSVHVKTKSSLTSTLLILICTEVIH